MHFFGWDEGEVDADAAALVAFCGEEGAAGHEGDALGEGFFEGGVEVDGLLELEPEEHASGGDLPSGEVGEVLLEGELHGVAFLSVVLAEGGDACVAGLGVAEHGGGDELGGAVAVQVGGLLELEQGVVEFGRAGEATEA